MTLRTDCRHFRPAEPCRPHKLTGARCASCREYAPVTERIVIVKLGAMGDVLRTTSCLPPLRARHPHAHVTWVTRANARPLLQGNPLVDRVLVAEGEHLALLLAEEFDLAIGPEADPLSASIMRVVRSAEKRGFVADGRGGVLPLGEAALAWWRTGVDDALKQANRRTYGEWLYDVCELPPPVAPPMLAVGRDAEARIARFLAAATPGARRRVCLNTGASARWREKRWTLAHYAAFARLLHAEDPDAVVIVAGGPEEAAFNAGLLAACPTLVDGGTDRSVEELGALMAACDWVLTADSLGYHVACAVGAPAVCLVGPTSPWELDRHGRNLVLHADVPCVACYRAECPLPRTCMDRLAPALVWRQVRAWRDGARGADRRADRVVAVPAGGEGGVADRAIPAGRAVLPVLAAGLDAGREALPC